MAGVALSIIAAAVGFFEQQSSRDAQLQQNVRDIQEIRAQMKDVPGRREFDDWKDQLKRIEGKLDQEISFHREGAR